MYLLLKFIIHWYSKGTFWTTLTWLVFFKRFLWQFFVSMKSSFSSKIVCFEVSYRIHCEVNVVLKVFPNCWTISYLGNQVGSFWEKFLKFLDSWWFLSLHNLLSQTCSKVIWWISPKKLSKKPIQCLINSIPSVDDPSNFSNQFIPS